MPNFIVSTKTFIFSPNSLTHDSFTHLTHKTSVLVLLTKFILNIFQYFAVPQQGASQLHF